MRGDAREIDHHAENLVGGREGLTLVIVQSRACTAVDETATRARREAARPKVETDLIVDVVGAHDAKALAQHAGDEARVAFEIEHARRGAEHVAGDPGEAHARCAESPGVELAAVPEAQDTRPVGVLIGVQKERNSFLRSLRSRRKSPRKNLGS